MASPSGYCGQIGWKLETVWGTAVVVDSFAPLLSEEIKNDGGERLVSQGIKACRALPHTHKRGAATIAGPMRFELANTDILDLLTVAFGSAATNTGVTTFTPGTNTQSLTVQVGIPDATGTVQTKTYAGVKLPQVVFNAQAGQLCTVEYTTSAKSEAPDTALATASYDADWSPFAYTEGSVTIAGGAVAVDSFQITLANTLRTDRKAVGSPTITEQRNNGFKAVTIGVEMDFEDRDQYDAFLDDDNVTLVLDLDNGADSLVFTAKGYLTGDSPTLSGPGIVKQPLSFVAESVTSDADAFTAVYTPAA